MIHCFQPTGCCFSSLNLIFMTHDIVMFSCIVKDISQKPGAGVSFQNHLLLEIKASNLLLLRYFACRQSYVYVSSNIPQILDFSSKPMDLRILHLISSIEHSCLEHPPSFHCNLPWPCEFWGYNLSCHFHIRMFTPFDVSLLSLRMSPLLTWHSDVGWICSTSRQQTNNKLNKNTPNTTQTV